MILLMYEQLTAYEAYGAYGAYGAYEEDNCEDEKAKHLSEVNSTFECLLTMKGGEVLAEEILVADTSFLVCENILTFSGRGGWFGTSTSEPIFKAGD